MRPICGASVCLGCLAAAVFAAEAARAIKFGKDDAGKLPKGWTATQTGKGEGSVWKVVADDTAPSKSGFALAQTAKGPRPLFNLCVLDDSNAKDVELSVAFKPVEGQEDQGGGVLWRYQDADNYYTCRYNPLEGNFRVYKVEAGRRTQLDSVEKLDLKAGAWHVLSVRHVGEQIECSLAGKKHLAVKDASFPKAGKVGLWTKADAVTRFDDFTTKTLP